MSELQSVSLDLANLTGSTVEIRLRPPLGFWRIDFAALAGCPGPAGSAGQNSFARTTLMMKWPEVRASA
jgi:hypothetical protein